MSDKNIARKPKNKGLSLTIIALSVILFIASGVLVFLTLFEGKVPVANVGADNDVVGDSNAIVPSVKEEDINPALNDALISVVLDEYSVRSNESFKAQTCTVNTSDAKALLDSYMKYLDSLEVEGIRYSFNADDYDGDGATEYYLYVYFPVKATFDALGNSQAYTDYINNAGDGSDSQGIIIYGDTDSSSTVFRSYYSGTDYYDEHNISVNGGVMSVSHGTSVDEVYVVFTPYTVYESYAYQDEAFRSMCDNYANSLKVQGYSDIYYYCADLSDAEGEETVFVFTDAYGKVNVRVVTFINGKIHYVYENFAEYCATYIVEINSLKYLVEYSQVMGLESDNYESNYFYRIYRFDSKYVSVEYERNETTVKYGSVTSENEAFFEKFNAYISNAIVLSDPYEITGYASLTQSSGMSTHEPENGSTDAENETAYLRISNCSTSKQGIVNVPETSHLNFRRGPSVDYPKILIDNTDDDSYVRQLKGSSVTVMDTVNITDDDENPVWLKIQIKYNELTLEGYSSQTWIDLPGIKHISQGTTFTVNADTNEDSITWSCNDTSVARIDSSTGEITAIKPGLVLITVTSESGLTDSCLVAID